MSRTHRESQAAGKVPGTKSDQALMESYVAELRARTEPYHQPVATARRIVDEAMGASRLTDLLSKLRDEDQLM